MRSPAMLGLAMLLGLSAAGARAAEPEAPLPALALVPKESLAFIHVPNLKTLEQEVSRFVQATGWHVAKTGNPVTDQIVRRTGIQAGLDWDAPAAMAYLNPKQFPNRYTVYVLPVADWDALLKASQAELTTEDIYALTATGGPCFLRRAGRFAVVTSSMRTLKEVREAGGILGLLPAETRARASAAAGPMLYVDVHKLVMAYEQDITEWLRVSSRQVVGAPQAGPYGEVLKTYILGLADLLDQIETLEGTLRFGQDGVAVDAVVRFVPGASIANFLSAQVPGPALPPPWGDVRFTSAISLQLDPKTRTDVVMRIVTYFLENAPRPRPLQEGTKGHVSEAVQTLMRSLGPRLVVVSAPASLGFGTVCEVTVVDLQDPQEFKRAVPLLVSAWEELADQMDLYFSVRAVEATSEMEGVPVNLYVPRFRFGTRPIQGRFTEGLRALYGPEGLTYRVAVVGQKAVVATGSDLALFKRVIENLKQDKPAAPPGMTQLLGRLPGNENLSIMTSLPLFIRESLLLGGTPEERIGTVDPGKELAGLSFSAQGASIRAGSFWPHEQLRLAKELLDRVAPEVSKQTESLFEPPKEGPPSGTAPAPTAKPKTGEKPLEKTGEKPAEKTPEKAPPKAEEKPAPAPSM